MSDLLQQQLKRELDFEYGAVAQVAPQIRRVIAHNPGPFTFYGTGTYIIGKGEVAIIDPGPALSSHVEALLQALQGETITHILITHTHLDHSPATRLLQQYCDAPSYGYGAHAAEVNPTLEPVEEGADWAFVPDMQVRDGDIIHGATWQIECVHTPGHTSNHICYQLQNSKTLFSGDHVMGWSSSVIIPPDGDMGQYIASLEKLLERDDDIYWPTHGPAIENPQALVRAFIQHRHERVNQIIQCLQQGLHTIDELVASIYREIPQQLHPAAARSTFAALLYLQQQGKLHCDGRASLQSYYQLV